MNDGECKIEYYCGGEGFISTCKSVAQALTENDKKLIYARGEAACKEKYK